MEFYKDYPILEVERPRARKIVWHSLLASKSATMTRIAQITIAYKRH